VDTRPTTRLLHSGIFWFRLASRNLTEKLSVKEKGMHKREGQIWLHCNQSFIPKRNSAISGVLGRALVFLGRMTKGEPVKIVGENERKLRLTKSSSRYFWDRKWLSGCEGERIEMKILRLLICNRGSGTNGPREIGGWRLVVENRERGLRNAGQHHIENELGTITSEILWANLTERDFIP
jgi:hypothetical protein